MNFIDVERIGNASAQAAWAPIGLTANLTATTGN